MLSAAHDILKEESGDNTTTTTTNSTNKLDCNKLSTGVSRFEKCYLSILFIIIILF